ncbi:MAG TPA: hypothetical protein VM597_15275, partial [Gemmataceae bacterium]|nr:hypothetical protein [Gemmataceae bacterium]
PAPVGFAEADTRRTAGVPIVEPIPDSAPGAVPIWEAISAETANASATDTDRRKREPRSSRRFKGKPAEEPSAKGKSSIRTKAAPKADSTSKLAVPAAVRGMSMPVLLVTAVAAMILLVAGGIAVWYLAFRSPPKTTPTARGGENRRLVVSKAGSGQPHTFATLSAAANEFKPGDQIVLADSEWDESVILRHAKNLVITAAEGKRVTWRVSKDAPVVLSLVNPEATRISGIKFVGLDRVDVVVRLSGRCTGLTLEDVDIIGGTTAGLELHDADGEKGKPLTVKNARFQSGTVPGKAAVVFTAQEGNGKGGRAPASDEVAFEDCTITGPYTDGGFLFDGGATGVTIRNSRVWKSDAGLRFRRPRPDVVWQVAAIGNTFAGHRAGVHCEEIGLMKAKPETTVRLVQNYFQNCGEVIQAEGDQNMANTFKGSEGNGRKQGSNAGAEKLVPTAEVPGLDLPENPGDPKSFLTYDRNHPLFKAFNGKPIGASPE